MAITWTDARAKIRGDLWRTTQGIPDDVLDRALQNACLELESERRWLWLETIATTVPLIAAANSFTAPVDVGSLTSIGMIRSTGDYDVLDLEPLSVVLARVGALPVGTWPAMYAFAGGLIRLDANAPIGAIFELVYTARTPESLDLAVAAPANVTLQRQQGAIIPLAAAYVAGTFLRNPGEAGRQRDAYTAILLRLMGAEDMARSDIFGGGILPDTYYSDAAYGAS